MELWFEKAIEYKKYNGLWEFLRVLREIQMIETRLAKIQRESKSIGVVCEIYLNYEYVISGQLGLRN